MIPSFKEYFYPFMLFLADGEKRKMTEIRKYISDSFALTEDDQKEKTKGGKLRHNERVSWAASYLKKMKLILLDPKLGYSITKEGLEIFEKHGEKFNLNIIRDLEGYHRLQKKEGSANDYWVPSHYTASGRYVPGYVSQWENKGRQKFFSTKEEAMEYVKSKQPRKKN